MDEKIEIDWKEGFGELAKFSLDKVTQEIYWITPKGKFIYTNKKTRDNLGYSKKKLENKYIWEIDPNYDKESRKGFWNKLKKEKTLNFRSKHRTKQGEKYPVEITSHYIHFKGNEYEFAFARDITKQKEIKDQLQERKNKLLQIIQGISIPTFVIDENHRVIHWNKALEELSGIKKEKVLGTKKQWKGFYEQERPVLADLILENASKEKIKQYYGEKYEELHLLDGAYEAEDHFPNYENGKWLYFTAAPLKNSEGEKIGAIETLQDITQQKKAEEKFKRLFEASPDPTYLINKNGVFQEINQAGINILGYEKEEVIGKNIKNVPFFSQETKEKLIKNFNKRLKEKDIPPYTIESEDKNGEQLYAEINGALIKDEENEPIGIIVIARDITELKQSKERKDFLNTLLRQDLRSNCRVIKGYLELIEEDLELSEKHKEHLKKAKEVGEDAEKILKLANILEEVERTDWITEKDIIQVLKHALNSISELIKKENVEIKTNYLEKNSKINVGYSFEKFFKNLLITRIQISGAKTIKVNINERKENFLVTVKDDGKQLSKEIKNILSGKVYKGETTGIGGVRYYMLKEIANHNNTKIKAKNSELGGARFDITLNKT